MEEEKETIKKLKDLIKLADKEIKEWTDFSDTIQNKIKKKLHKHLINK